MPTILVKDGWRFFFYANEGNEPIHVHCKNGDKECKYWLDSANFEVREAYSYDMSPRDTRNVKKLIFENFEYIEEKWRLFKEAQ